MMRERSTPERQDDDQRGREAEAQAAMWLTQQGWRIVAERVKTKAGEIDLIAKRPGLVAFAKVKWRARAASLGDAIDERRLTRIAKAAEVVAHEAEVVAHEYATNGQDIRIHVILLAPGSKPTHIENGWMPFG
jgi:putative endonuclease